MLKPLVGVNLHFIFHFFAFESIILEEEANCLRECLFRSFNWNMMILFKFLLNNHLLFFWFTGNALFFENTFYPMKVDTNMNIKHLLSLEWPLNIVVRNITKQLWNFFTWLCHLLKLLIMNAIFNVFQGCINFKVKMLVNKTLLNNLYENFKAHKSFTFRLEITVCTLFTFIIFNIIQKSFDTMR